MKIKDNKYVCWGLTAVCVIALAFVIYYIIFHFGQIQEAFDKIIAILMPVIVGFILAYILTPILNFFENKVFTPLLQKTKKGIDDKRKKRIRGYSIILTYVFFIAVIYGFIALVVNTLVESVNDIIKNSDMYVANLTAWFNGFIDNNENLRNLVAKALDNYSDSITEFVTKNVIPKFSDWGTKVYDGLFGTVKALWNFIFGLIISIYFLGGKERFLAQFKKICYALLSESSANRLCKNLSFCNTTFGGYLAGKVADSFVIGCICYIGCVIMNDPYSALLAVIIGVTNIIPCFGPIIGAIPTTFIILMVDPLKALYFVIFIIILQQFDGNLIGPKILGDKIGLSSFWVLFSIVLFGGLYGFVGLLIGVPLFAIIFAAVKTLIEKKLTKRGLPQGTNTYLNLLYIDSSEFHYEEPKPETPAEEKAKRRFKFGKKKD